MAKKLSADQIVQLSKVDESAARTAKRDIEIHSTTLNKIVDSICKPYCRDLDDTINAFTLKLKNQEDIPDSELSEMSMYIAGLIYVAGNGLETLGMELDTAEGIRKEKFNEYYQTLDTGTIKDRESFAFNESLQEFFIEACYERAYKKMKMKLENAVFLAQSIKKSLDYRMRVYSVD